MKNIPLLILLGIIVLMIMCMSDKEKFSQSGLAISDRYCQKLADVYYNPKTTDVNSRFNYRKRICGKQRRNTIDNRMGNYYTDYGILV